MERRKVETSQKIQVVKLSDTRISYQRFESRVVENQTYFTRFKCVHYQDGCKSLMYVPVDAPVGARSAIINYDKHICVHHRLLLMNMDEVNTSIVLPLLWTF